MKKENRIIQINDINIGQNIKKMREQKMLTQKDMLARLHLHGIEISDYSLSKIEHGKQNPTVSLLRALTQILDCDYNSFFQ